ncbi:hypothetical protein ASE63_06680 [Bosea sp. Root381]|nr:hypothetical protein ASE63_06680 [Bosea sp. Root381]
MLHPDAPDVDFAYSRYRAELPRLVKKMVGTDPAAALALIQYDRATSAPANDNIDLTVENDDNRRGRYADPDVHAAPAGIVMDTDSILRTRPSIDELLAAAPPGSPVIFDKRAHRGDPVIARCGTVVLDLTPGQKHPIDTGFIVEYGRTSKGRPRRPSTRMTGDRGPAEPKRSQAAVWAYLRLPASDPTAKGWRRPCAPLGAVTGGLHGMPRSESANRFGVAEGRALLRGLGVDGDVPFEIARLQARRIAVQHRPGIAKGAEFGGVTQAAKADKSQPVPVPERDPRDELTAETVAVLEIVLSGGTLENIGRHLGAPASTAARHGKPALLAAVDEVKRVMGVAANDNEENCSEAA